MALMELRDITRVFTAGDMETVVLRDVDLSIEAGEMVAIIGQSGSGKSTLMNILGCLDRPSSGTYRFGGAEVGAMDADALAELRRAHFGFIFQRYQLLGALDAVGNTEIPAIYRGTARPERRARAETLLTRLGLGERLANRPSALSGGQQQRVSVARALINGGEVILADEPTGALDSRSGAELIALLKELHAEGHTIILVTHDPQVAASAERIVEIRDGRILSDTRQTAHTPRARLSPPPPEPAGLRAYHHLADRLREAAIMALKAMTAHRLRTFLTMLGIIIGISSVVTVVALGKGSQQKVLENIASIGTSTIDIRRGTGFGDRAASRIETLIAEDAEALAAQPYATSASPEVSQSVKAAVGNLSATVSLRGVSVEYFDVAAYVATSGQTFSAEDLARRAQVVVLDEQAAKTLFPAADPVGQTLQIGRVPMRVLGVVRQTAASMGPQSVKVFSPYTTVMARVTGKTTVDSISVRISDSYEMSAAESLITDLLTARHGKQDFFLTNSDAIRNSIQSTTQTMTWLISAIAVISLMVGGIGVMTIMLVSVTERTREIGVRIAVGARQSDITAQFLIEAVLVCLLGGVLGVGLALLIGQVIGLFTSEARLIYSGATMLIAFASSSLIGVIFGFLPARAAAKLDPVAALARE